jgi:transposase
LEDRVPQDHPLRAIRKLVDEVLRAMAKDFDGLYSKVGRPSVPPERLLRAVLLQIFYTVRSEWMLMEQMNYNLLFRWFVGLELDEPVWNHAVFSKNRDRLLNQEVAREFFTRVLAQAKPHLSDEHFSVDGTLIEAWAARRAFKRRMVETMIRERFVANGAATTRTNRRRMPMLGCTAKGMGRKPNSAIWATC